LLFQLLSFFFQDTIRSALSRKTTATQIPQSGALAWMLTPLEVRRHRRLPMRLWRIGLLTGLILQRRQLLSKSGNPFVNFPYYSRRYEREAGLSRNAI